MDWNDARSDRTAFDALVEPLEPRVRAAIRRETGARVAARVELDDLVQETWLRAFRAFGSFRGDDEAALGAWIETIAVRVVRDAGRRAGRGVDRREVPLDPGPPAGGSHADTSRGGDALPHEAASPGRGPVTPAPTPSRALRRGERRDRLRAALADLSEDHRRVIEWVRLEGLPVREAAERLGRSPNATSMLLLRALTALRDRFGDTESLHLPADGPPDEGPPDGPPDETPPNDEPKERT